MNKALNPARIGLLIGVPVVLFTALIGLMSWPGFSGNSALNLAITLDLLITVPVAYYLVIRKTAVPKTTVIPVMIAGLLIGSSFLPEDGQTYLDLFKTWALPAVELGVLAYVVIKVRSAISIYKGLQGATPDFYRALQTTCRGILPESLALACATEIAVIYYGLLHWRSRSLRDREFRYHRKSGTPALMGAFVFVIGIETFALHLLLEQWSSVAAWVLSALSVYTALQVLGFAKSLAQRPIAIEGQQLMLRYGILNECEIPLQDIASVELSSKPLPKEPLARKLSPMGEMERHNVIIHLKRTHVLRGIYGLKMQWDTLALHVDEPVRFKAQLDDQVG